MQEWTTPLAQPVTVAPAVSAVITPGQRLLITYNSVAAAPFIQAIGCSRQLTLLTSGWEKLAAVMLVASTIMAMLNLMWGLLWKIPADVAPMVQQVRLLFCAVVKSSSSLSLSLVIAVVIAVFTVLVRVPEFVLAMKMSDFGGFFLLSTLALQLLCAAPHSWRLARCPSVASLQATVNCRS